MKHLKQPFLTLLFLAASLTTFAQVGVGTTSPDASAALDVESTTKGLLIPRMTTAERTAIASPAMGLQVFDNTTNTNWYYNGTAWVEVAGADDLGDHTATQDLDLVANKLVGNGGTGGIAISASGNVGIGTTTPTELMELKASSPSIKITSNSGSSTVQQKLIFETHESNRGGGILWQETNNADRKSFFGRAYSPGGSDTKGVVYRATTTGEDVLGSSNNSDVKFFLGDNGRVAIGTILPQETKLTIVGEPTVGELSKAIALQSNDGNQAGQIGTSGTSDNNNKIVISSNRGGDNAGVELRTLSGSMIINSAGNVGIGITAPTEKLHVDGNILATGTITPDYVFQKYYDGESALKADYTMASLSEIEAFTRANKHLPGVPSAQEVEEKGGILINRATEINLEKIEELYLHTIEQQQQIELLQAQVKALLEAKE